MSRTLIMSILLASLLFTMSCAKRNTSYEDGVPLELLQTIPVVGDPCDLSYDGEWLYVALDQGGMAGINTTNYNLYWYTNLSSEDGSPTKLNRIRFVDYIAEHNVLFVYDTFDTDNITFVNTANPDSLRPYGGIIGDSQNIVGMSLHKLDNDPDGNILEFMYARLYDVKYGRNDGGFWMGSELSLDVEFPIRGISMDENNIYVAEDQRGLFTYSRASQQLLSEISFYGYAQNMAVHDNIVYVAARHGGLQIVDVNNSQNPQLIAGYDTSGYASNVEYHDGKVAVSSGSGGVYLFDVNTPANPKLLAHITDCGYANTVTFADDKLVVASRDEGILFYEIN